MNPNSLKTWKDFRGGACWGTSGGPNSFWASRMGPQRFQSAFIDWKMNQPWHQKTLRFWKRASKIMPFRSLARRTARSAYVNSRTSPETFLTHILFRNVRTLTIELSSTFGKYACRETFWFHQYNLRDHQYSLRDHQYGCKGGNRFV